MIKTERDSLPVFCKCRECFACLAVKRMRVTTWAPVTEPSKWKVKDWKLSDKQLIRILLLEIHWQRAIGVELAQERHKNK